VDTSEVLHYPATNDNNAIVPVLKYLRGNKFEQQSRQLHINKT